MVETIIMMGNQLRLGLECRGIKFQNFLLKFLLQFHPVFINCARIACERWNIWQASVLQCTIQLLKRSLGLVKIFLKQIIVILPDLIDALK